VTPIDNKGRHTHEYENDRCICGALSPHVMHRRNIVGCDECALALAQVDNDDACQEAFNEFIHRPGTSWSPEVRDNFAAGWRAALLWVEDGRKEDVRVGRHAR
jgi:hypothetical protein